VFGGWPYCDETAGQCGNAQLLSGQVDYASYETYPYVLSYELVYSQLTNAQRQAFADFMLNDNSQSNMGLGIQGAPDVGCTKITLTNGTGTITTTAGGNVVVGSGTSFVTQLSVGQFVYV